MNRVAFHILLAKLRPTSKRSLACLAVFSSGSSLGQGPPGRKACLHCGQASFFVRMYMCSCFTGTPVPQCGQMLMTGIRLSIGVAWLVIVAAEMLTGGIGIGFWVWDEWNNLNVKNIIIAIFVIGIVGMLLEYALIKIATAFTFEEVKS